MRIRSAVVVLVLLLAGCSTTIDGTASPAPVGWEFVSEQPCAETGAEGADDFSCVTLSVPVDHARPGGEHWDVTFAVLRAEGERQGVFVTSTGGPGSSGLASAEAYTAAFPDEIRRDFDVVFFDQRGVGLSQDFRCDDTYYGSFFETVDSSSPAAERDAYAEAATRFGLDCFAEAGVDPATAPRYATAQAVEDLEAFRQWLDAPALTLYGESYGTQYVQTYAAAHPERVVGLVVDGVVDLGTELSTFAVQAAQAYSRILVATLTACDADPGCAAAAPGDSLAGYDALVSQLASTPVEVPGGGTVDDLTLRSAASGGMSDPYSRGAFQEAVNAAINGDYTGLDELGNYGVGPDPAFSDALFYAVECQDYDVVPAGTDPRVALDGWLSAAAAAGVDALRLGDVYYGDTPCHFWPGVAGTPDFARPAPVTDPPYPVLVLTADTDPNTPVVGAEEVFRDLVPGAGPADAQIVQLGGPHVVYGRGDPCIDDPTNVFITTGAVPPQPVTVCPGEIAYD